MAPVDGMEKGRHMAGYNGMVSDAMVPENVIVCFSYVLVMWAGCIYRL